MNIITHHLVPWNLAEQLPCPSRDRHLLCWAGVPPDLHGAGVLLDWAARGRVHGATNFNARFHHPLLHGVAGAVLIAALLVRRSAEQQARCWPP